MKNTILILLVISILVCTWAFITVNDAGQYYRFYSTELCQVSTSTVSAVEKGRLFILNCEY